MEASAYGTKQNEFILVIVPLYKKQIIILTRLLTCTRDSRDARLPCNPIRDAAHGLAIGVFGGKHQSSIQPFSQSVSQLVSQSLSQSASQPASQSVSQLFVETTDRIRTPCHSGSGSRVCVWLRGQFPLTVPLPTWIQQSKSVTKTTHTQKSITCVVHRHSISSNARANKPTRRAAATRSWLPSWTSAWWSARNPRPRGSGATCAACPAANETRKVDVCPRNTDAYIYIYTYVIYYNII